MYFLLLCGLWAVGCGIFYCEALRDLFEYGVSGIRGGAGTWQITINSEKVGIQTD